jgi:hypothetical protein
LTGYRLDGVLLRTVLKTYNENKDRSHFWVMGSTHLLIPIIFLPLVGLSSLCLELMLTSKGTRMNLIWFRSFELLERAFWMNVQALRHFHWQVEEDVGVRQRKQRDGELKQEEMLGLWADEQGVREIRSAQAFWWNDGWRARGLRKSETSWGDLWDSNKRRAVVKEKHVLKACSAPF